jgi:hypothetical protein
MFRGLSADTKLYRCSNLEKYIITINKLSHSKEEGYDLKYILVKFIVAGNVNHLVPTM